MRRTERVNQWLENTLPDWATQRVALTVICFVGLILLAEAW